METYLLLSIPYNDSTFNAQVTPDGALRRLTIDRVPIPLFEAPWPVRDRIERFQEDLAAA